MNTALIRKELRETRWKLSLGVLLLSILAAALPIIYETIMAMLAEITAEMGWLANLLPPAILENFSAYLWSQWHGKNLYQVGTLLAVLYGMNTVAGEVSGNTMTFLLTRPLSRKAVYLSKVVSGIISLTLIVGVSTGVMLTVAVIFTAHSVDVARLLTVTSITLLGILVVYALAVLLSSLIDEPVKAGGMTALILFLFSILGWLPAARRFSLFAHMPGTMYFLNGQVPVWPVTAMLLALAILLAVGMRVMDQKEF